MRGADRNIDQALDAFLAAQQARLAPRTFVKYADIVELLRHSLNGYAYNGLDAADRRRWDAVFQAGDEEAFCHVFGPERIPEHLGEFLGYYMIRKVMAGEELLQAAGTVTKRLARWLGEQGHIEDAVRAAAVERGTEAARELPRADRLARLLYRETERCPEHDRAELPATDVVADFLAIERVDPGALWFEGGVGPLAVTREISGLAQPGWSVNIVLVKLRGRWRIAEVGAVYP